MNPVFFQQQMKRLQTRFGVKNFDQEFVQIIWTVVREMSEPGFQRLCDVFIGTRTPNKPPLISDFREAVLAEQKRKFENDLRGATNFLQKRAPEEMRKNMRAVLSKEFGAVESASEALEIARIRIKTRQADDTPDGAA